MKRAREEPPAGADFVLYDEGEEEEDEDEEEEEEEEEEDEDGEEDELEALPISLLLYADEIISDTTETFDKDGWTSASQALDKAKLLLYALEPEMKAMVEKAMKRVDGKVPPGSAMVQRTLNDKRYLACQICLAKAKVASSLQLDLSTQATILLLREALVLFPRSVEANVLLAAALKPLATSAQLLLEVEELLKKATSTKAALLSAPTASNSSSSSSSSSSNPSDEDHIFIARELTAADTAQQQLSLLLCQSGRSVEATKHLVAQKYTWRLSNQALDYPSSPSASLDSDADNIVQVLDGVFAPAVVSHMQHALRDSSPFWSEHSYDLACNASRRCGYFSYLYPLKSRPAACSVEQLIDMIHSRACAAFPAAMEECTVAEWWTHTRPHTSGHQLHFDSDETKIEDGGSPQHPIVSCILFLSEGVGGPTLVTDQTLAKETLAQRGWLCHSRPNRLCLFDARHLHGVVPGKGCCPAAAEKDGGPRRLTFMVGFWRKICARDRGLDTPGAGQPFPSSTSAYSWPKEFPMQPAGFALNNTDDVAKVAPIQITSVWEPVEEGAAKRKNIPSFSQCFQGF